MKKEDKVILVSCKHIDNYQQFVSVYVLLVTTWSGMERQLNTVTELYPIQIQQPTMSVLVMEGYKAPCHRTKPTFC